MRWIIYGLIVLLAIAHQDWWWWDDSETLVLGFLPIGLAYHAGVSVAAALLWGLAIKFCWPRDVDVLEESVVTGRTVASVSANEPARSSR